MRAFVLVLELISIALYIAFVDSAAIRPKRIWTDIILGGRPFGRVSEHRPFIEHQQRNTSDSSTRSFEGELKRRTWISCSGGACSSSQPESPPTPSPPAAQEISSRRGIPRTNSEGTRFSIGPTDDDWRFKDLEHWTYPTNELDIQQEPKQGEIRVVTWLGFEHDPNVWEVQAWYQGQIGTFAAKGLSKLAATREMFDNEFEILLYFREHLSEEQKVHVQYLTFAVFTFEEAERKWLPEFVVMPYCEIGDMSELLEISSWGAVGQRRDVFLQIATGLQAMHSLGVAHLDIKPANVFLTRETGTSWVVAKLADFESSTMKKTLKEDVGTPFYGAPEQRSSDDTGQPYDTQQADIWQLGATFLELVKGTNVLGEVFAARSSKITLNYADNPTSWMVHFLEASGEDLSQEFLDLLIGMMRPLVDGVDERTRRYTVDEVVGRLKAMERVFKDKDW